MFREICKSKIHRARVTDANLNYTGSITIARDLMDAADLVQYEKVQVVNINNGARFETYVIEGEPGSGTICLNGAAARLALPDDLVIVISYCLLDGEELKKHKPNIVLLDSENRIVQQT